MSIIIFFQIFKIILSIKTLILTQKSTVKSKIFELKTSSRRNLIEESR